MKILWLLSIGALACAARPAAGATPPVGYMIQTLPTTGSEATTRYLGTPLADAALFAGAVSWAGANTIHVSAEDGWTAGEFTRQPCYVRVTSGRQAGRTLAVLGSTATQLTVDITDGSAQATTLNSAGFALVVGDSFEVIPNWTLGKLFAGAAADRVGVWNLSRGTFDNYTFDTGSGRWVKEGASASEDYTDLPLPPHAALAVERQPGRATARILLTGSPATVAPLLKLAGNGVLQYTGFPLPADTMLGQLDLGANWQKKKAYKKADTLSIYKANRGQWRGYCEHKDGQWYRPNGALKSAAVIPAGGVVGLLKRKPVSGADSFLSILLPYTP